MSHPAWLEDEALQLHINASTNNRRICFYTPRYWALQFGLMESKLISKGREEHFCIATSVVAAFEKEAAAQPPSLLQLLAQCLHDGRFSGSCRTM
jgi:hypothetical protein